MRRTALALCLVVQFAGPAAADDPEVQPSKAGHFVSVSGAQTYDLMKECERATVGDVTGCAGYIMGVYDALAITAQVCRPEDTDTSDDALVAIVRKNLMAEPEEWTQSPARLIGDVLRATWPCLESRPTNHDDPFAPGTTLSLDQIMKSKGVSQ